MVSIPEIVQWIMAGLGPATREKERTSGVYGVAGARGDLSIAHGVSQAKQRNHTET
jgi:hypothetical protein